MVSDWTFQAGILLQHIPDKSVPLSVFWYEFVKAAYFILENEFNLIPRAAEIERINNTWVTSPIHWHY